MWERECVCMLCVREECVCFVFLCVWKTARGTYISGDVGWKICFGNSRILGVLSCHIAPIRETMLRLFYPEPTSPERELPASFLVKRGTLSERVEFERTYT